MDTQTLLVRLGQIDIEKDDWNAPQVNKIAATGLNKLSTDFQFKVVRKEKKSL